MYLLRIECVKPMQQVKKCIINKNVEGEVVTKEHLRQIKRET